MKLDYNIYNVDEIDKLLINIKFLKNNKKIEYGNVACSLDIEVSSFYEDDEKRAIMYVWVLGINGKCIIGRTYKELLKVFEKISNYYNLYDKKRLIFYIHNLSYEFQFIKDWFSFTKVFASEKRKPIYALTNIGIEFRCSYLLSGYSLNNLTKKITTYEIKKMVGDLDYSLIRHSKTPLTEKELGYILNDGLIVMAFIQEEIKYNKGIINIPLTKTSYVRNYCRKNCLQDKNKSKFLKYRQLIERLIITSKREYEMLINAFQGGYTHANGLAINKVIKNVTSLDETSAYPYVMISEKFPMGRGKKVKINNTAEFKKYLKSHCCLFNIKIYGLKSIHNENPIGYSKCRNVKNATINNGRIVECDYLETTITEQHFFIYKNFYKWEKIVIGDFFIYKKQYLPTDLVKCILKLYWDKTTLKDVNGKELEYFKSKENINSCYGMCVTSIIKENYGYDNLKNEWTINEPNIEKEIEKYNKSINRFLSYHWGIWVTAYAQRNLFKAIYNVKEDYVYTDTDSVKFTNYEKHKYYFEYYNRKVEIKLKKALEYHKLPFELCKPKTIEGKEKMLGVWDFDGFYTQFKTMGAKRYMYVKNNEINFTISGLNKKVCIPYLKERFNNNFNDIFKFFDEGMYIPPSATGKNIHTYLDYEQKGTIRDYLGQIGTYYEKSSIHMEGADFEMSMSREFIDYLMGIKEIEL